jgi:hypothetical protein
MIFEKKRHKLEKEKGGPLSGDLDYKGKMFTNLCCSLNLSYSSFNFCNFSLDCLCNFSTRLSLALILEAKND